MAVLKFRIYFEEDDSIYRDVAIKHTQSFLQLQQVILKAYEFDNKHQATFYRSNDNWLRGREISLEQYDKEYKVAPLIMADTLIGSEITNPNQKYIRVAVVTRGHTIKNYTHGTKFREPQRSRERSQRCKRSRILLCRISRMLLIEENIGTEAGAHCNAMVKK